MPPAKKIVSGLQIFRFSIWKGKPTPGLALMNLRYRNERPEPNGKPVSPAAFSNRLSIFSHLSLIIILSALSPFPDELSSGASCASNVVFLALLKRFAIEVN